MEKIRSFLKSPAKKSEVVATIIFIATFLIVVVYSIHGQQFAHRRLHSTAGPASIYPRPELTPGATNPDVTQDTIEKTICVAGWTKTVRPPASYTNSLKVKQIAEYGYSDTNVKDYEEDHFIPLELGGNPTDPHNLWPEPYNTQYKGKTVGAHEKDKVENWLKVQVCSGGMTLDEARHAIVDDWYRIYRTHFAEGLIEPGGSAWLKHDIVIPRS